MLRAGAAIADLTPELPCFLAGMGDARPLARRVHDPICARALVIEDGGERIALCAIDTLGVNTVDRRAVQERVGSRLGWAPHQVLIAGTHTHNGPLVLRFYGKGEYPAGTPYAAAFPREHFEKDMDGNASRGYWEFAIPRIAQALTAAAGQLQDAELAIGAGSVSLNINRWHARGDERIFIPYARKLNGASSQDLPANQRCDPETTVLHFRRRGGGRTIATWLHWTAHPICVCLQADELSADYPFFAGRELEKALGGVFVFTNGALGDVHPKEYDTGYAQAEELGRALAADALRALAGQPYRSSVPVHIQETGIFLAYLDVNSERGRKGIQMQAPRAAGEKGRTTSFAAGRIGNFGFSTWPGEPWAELAFRIKERNPFPFKALLGCANDYQGYFALRETLEGKTFDTVATQPWLYDWPAGEAGIGWSVEALRASRG